MPAKVKTLYLNIFHMPGDCVSCGKPASPGLTHKVIGSRSDFSGKHTTSLTVEFPICTACSQVSQERGGAKAITWIGVLVSIGLCLLSWILAESASGNTILGIGIAVAVFLCVALLFRWLAESLNQKGFNSDQRARRKQALKCARIASFKVPGMFDKNGMIEFHFENPAFAAEFSALNAGLPG